MFDDQSPIYRQIAERIKADVVAGTLPAEAQIMSTNQYASFYGINPATAARAFGELVEDGVLYKKRGVGMFVAQGAREKLVAERRAAYFSAILEPALREAHALGIPLTDLHDHIDAHYGTRS